MLPFLERSLSVLVSAALVWAALSDLRTRLIPAAPGFGMLAAGLVSLWLHQLWLESLFYVAALWGSRGGVWRLPTSVLAVVLVAKGGGALPFAAGVLYVLALFRLGWFGGGDAQLAFGLMALARDWWILGYLFGGTILLGLVVMSAGRGVRGGAQRFCYVLRHLDAPDEGAVKVPWGVLAAMGGLSYIWVAPGLAWG